MTFYFILRYFTTYDAIKIARSKPNYIRSELRRCWWR